MVPSFPFFGTSTIQAPTLRQVQTKRRSGPKAVDRYTSHVIFLMQFAQFIFMHITLHGSSVCMRASFHLHAIHDERLIVRSLSVSSCLSFSCFSLLFTSSLPYPTCSLTCTPPSMWTAPRETPAAPSPNEEYWPLALYHPPTKAVRTKSGLGQKRSLPNRHLFLVTHSPRKNVLRPGFIFLAVLALRSSDCIETCDIYREKHFLQMPRAVRAPQDHINADKTYRCQGCDNTFNHEVGVDVFDVVDSVGMFSILNAVCVGITYERAWVVKESETLGSPSSHACLPAFVHGWTRWAVWLGLVCCEHTTEACLVQLLPRTA